MTIEILRLLIDFGLLVLIWSVQRIIYPSFLHYSANELVKWHRIYTSRLTFIVLPLMFGQLAVSIYQMILKANFYSVMSFILVVLLWLSTFLQFVPLHSKISQGEVSQKILNSLVKKNWIRTILWTVLFLLSLLFATIL